MMQAPVVYFRAATPGVCTYMDDSRSDRESGISGNAFGTLGCQWVQRTSVSSLHSQHIL